MEIYGSHARRKTTFVVDAGIILTQTPRAPHVQQSREPSYHPLQSRTQAFLTPKLHPPYLKSYPKSCKEKPISASVQATPMLPSNEPL